MTTGDQGPGTPARRGRAHVRTFLADNLTPFWIYRCLRETSPVRFLLESVTGDEQLSRYSYIGAKPSRIYRIYRDRVEEERGGRRLALPGPPLTALRTILNSVHIENELIPFAGGYVGFFGYDMVQLTDRLAPLSPDPFSLPLAVLVRFDTLVVFDHAFQQVHVIANEIQGEIDVEDAEKEVERVSQRLMAGTDASTVAVPLQLSSVDLDVRESLARTAFDDDVYHQAALHAKERIGSGELEQVVLARRWVAEKSTQPEALYRAQRRLNPSPFMALLEIPDLAVVGASPETLVRKLGDRIQIRVISGSQPRGIDPDGDRRLAEDLKTNSRKVAKHKTLVDLAERALGKLNDNGAVNGVVSRAVERYRKEMHLMSRIETRLSSQKDSLDALLACFPAGSLAGVPRDRAIELINELEPERRGLYGGAVGYFSFSGNLATCTTNRTFLVNHGETSVTIGTDIDDAYDQESATRELEAKAARMFAVLQLANGIES